MNFWKPTKRKLTTFALLLLLMLVCNVVLTVSDKVTRHLNLKAFKSAIGPEAVEAYETVIRSEAKARFEMTQKIEADDVKRFDRIYGVQRVINFGLPAFFAYLAACIIHVQRKSLTPTE